MRLIVASFLLLVSVQASAIPITWKLAIEPEIDNLPPSIPHGTQLWVTFSEDISLISLQGPNRKSFFAHRAVTDVLLRIRGQKYGTGMHPEYGVGVVAVIQNTADYFGDQANLVGDFDRLSFDIYLEGGGRLFWDLASFSGLGNVDLFPESGFTCIPDPLGRIDPENVWVNVVQLQLADGSRMDGRVHTWLSVPEPTSLALMGLGLVGIGFTRRKKNS